MRDAIETAVPPGAEVTASSQPIERSAPSALLALQRGVGNQAVGRILAQLRSADRHAPTPAAIAPLLHHGLGGDRRAEARSGIAGAPVEHHAIPTAEGPRSVPVHDSDASHLAAARLGAWAYALDGSVALGAGVGCADGPTREEILRHELRHVSQMHQPGPPASSADLEREADAASGAPVVLSAGRDDLLGVFWFVAIGVGLYIVFRPNVANAPGPGDATQPSVSGTQVAAEAVAIFAPGMFTVRLARMGLGVVGAFAATGAMSSVASRGVQDVGGGSFSGARAYVVDAATGAVIGVFVGGVFRLTPSGARMAQQARQRPDLTHFTTPAGASGIGASNEMRGGTGIWALEASAEAETPLLRAVRGTIPRSAAQVGVRVPGQAPSNFSQPFPVGPYSAYRNAMGVWRAPAGVINMTTGAFTPTGRVLPNLAGHFIPYGADLLVWVGAGAAASLAPQEQDPAEVRRRGLFGSLGIDPPWHARWRSQSHWKRCSPVIRARAQCPTPARPAWTRGRRPRRTPARSSSSSTPARGLTFRPSTTACRSTSRDCRLEERTLAAPPRRRSTTRERSVSSETSAQTPPAKRATASPTRSAQRTSPVTTIPPPARRSGRH